MPFLDDLKNTIGDVVDIVKDSVETYSDMLNIFDDDDNDGDNGTVTVIQPQSQPPYNPNFSASNFGFSPNWNLVGIGAVLLAIVLIIKK